jgi:hypothetical protein
VARAKCECACEVYISFRAQAGTKDGGCMAANGDEASIIVFEGKGCSLWQSLCVIDSARSVLRGAYYEGIKASAGQDIEVDYGQTQMLQLRNCEIS